MTFAPLLDGIQLIVQLSDYSGEINFMVECKMLLLFRSFHYDNSDLTCLPLLASSLSLSKLARLVTDESMSLYEHCDWLLISTM